MSSGTSWLASTTTLVISSNTACKNWAQGFVKRLWSAVSVTYTWRLAARDANVSRLASGWLSQPKTSVCEPISSTEFSLPLDTARLAGQDIGSFFQDVFQGHFHL
jgi:hypothetical protein